MYLQLSSVQWVRSEAHALLHVLASLGLQEIVFIITYAKKLMGQVQNNIRKRTLECETMDGMREIVAVGVVSEVRDQLVKITGVGLEGAARGEVDVSNNFVHANPSRNVATFVCLLLQLLCPSFILALLKFEWINKIK